MNLNLNEYGQTIRVDFGQDVSSASAITLILEPKYGTKLEKTLASGDVSVGSSNVDVGDETYLANQYIEYTTVSGDISYAGQWRKRAEAQLSASNLVKTDYELFTVLE